MKYLLPFALIAVAMALPEPVRLLEPVQLADPAPLVVPQEVMDEVALKIKFVDAPETSEALETANSEFAVNFVDEAVNVDAPAAEAPEANADFAVNFVDEAVNVDAPAAEAPKANADFAVNFVDEAVNVDAPAAEALIDAVQFVDSPVENDASDYAVHFVDEAVNVDAPEASVVDPAESPILIKIVDLPLPASIVMPLMMPTIGHVQLFDAPVEGNADFAVKFVDVADVDEETPSYRPIKQYPDPMWR